MDNPFLCRLIEQGKHLFQERFCFSNILGDKKALEFFYRFL